MKTKLKDNSIQETRVRLQDKYDQAIRIELGKAVIADVKNVYSFSDGSLKGVAQVNNKKTKVIFKYNHNNWEVQR